jgi:hypothetical protein
MNDNTLRIEYMPLSQLAFWDANPKKHDVEGIMKSFKAYGFRDAPIWDAFVNDGKPGLVGGNGRIKVLLEMKKMDLTPPRGINIDESGEWLVPVQMGIDSVDADEARRFALDLNNLTMSGGDFDTFDFAGMWGDEYVSMLSDIFHSEQELASMDRQAIGEFLIGYAQQEEEIPADDAQKFFVVVNDPAQYHTILDLVTRMIEKRGYQAKVKERKKKKQ